MPLVPDVWSMTFCGLLLLVWRSSFSLREELLEANMSGAGKTPVALLSL